MTKQLIEIVVPQVGEAVAEVLLTEWLKQEGDEVHQGDVLFEVDTDKAVVEVEAFADGILSKILVSNHTAVMPQQVVALLTPLGIDPEPEAQIVPATAVSPDTSAKQNGAKESQASPVAQRMATDMGIELAQVIGSGPGGRIVASDVQTAVNARQNRETTPDNGRVPRTPASPKAKRLAASLGVDLKQIQGTGQDGLITVTDVELAAAVNEEVEVTAVAPPTSSSASEPFSKLRQTIATKMVASKQNVPHFYLMVDVDMSQAQQLRSYSQAVLGAEKPPTYTDIITRACALTLREMPQLNVQYANDGLHKRDSVDIGVAVSVPGGLIVPVIAQADSLTLSQTSQHIRAAAERARNGRLQATDIGPKSMSISNLGMTGIDAFVAIIDEPDPMILAVGRVAEKVVPFNGQIVIRPLSTFTLSVDHRVLDGMQGAEFLMRVKQRLEYPFELLGED